MPGSSTMIWSSPLFCTTGSDTPNSSMRVRTTLIARSSASDLFGDGALRLVDLEREVHAALQVEPALERNARDGVVDEAVTAFDPLDDLAREQRPHGRCHQRDDEQHAVLQVGHATAGRKGWFGKL